MRILHLSKTMGQGGAEKIVYHLAEESAKRDMFVAVASCGGVFVESLEKKGIVHYLIDDFDSKKITTMFHTFVTLMRVIRLEKIEILHTHHRMAAFYGWLLKLFFPKLKLLYTAHNVFYDRKLLTKLSLSSSVIVAVGRGVQENLINYFGINQNKIIVVYNTIFEERAEEKHEPLCKDLFTDEDVLVGMVGRISEQKGVDTFVKAMHYARKKNEHIRGVIVGDGDLREAIRNLIDECGMSDDICMVGYQSAVLDWMRKIDFLVMPSRWEGFPLTPIEAFCAGKTVIGSDIVGINEIIINGVNGILVEKDNVAGFGERILELAANLTLREKLESAGSEYYQKNFDYNVFIERYISLYKDMVI